MKSIPMIQPKNKRRAPLVLACFVLLGIAGAAESESAKDVIQNFYHVYLDRAKDPPIAAPKLVFSKSFGNLIAAEEEMCRKKAGTDICGWAADEDPYLDSQEGGPTLSYATSGITFTEKNPGRVEVDFNVYPSDKAGATYYHRHLTFVMIREDGHWVVDDMLGGDGSSREAAQKEIDFYKNLAPTK